MSIGIPFGKYRLVRRLARGGMAEVFLATQKGLGGFERTVAVKRILPHLADVEQFLEMFLDEARLAAQLSHPNVAHIYDFGEVNDSYFIAMEFIDGVDLSPVVLDGPRRPLPLEHCARIIADVCAGLHHAHHLKGNDGKPLGIVHRDISPQNILVSFDGPVKIVDFGIAKAAYHIERTKPGVVRGKFTYMSPEQVMGKPLDGRSDLFSAGIVLYELCTCKALFPRTDAVQAMQLIRSAEIPEPTRNGEALPPKLSAILKRSLARDREDRYQSAADMQMELEEYLRTASQISNAILVGQYFTEHYRRLRPEPKASSAPASDGTADVGRKTQAAGGAPPGTMPAQAAGGAPPGTMPAARPAPGASGGLDSDVTEISSPPHSGEPQQPSNPALAARSAAGAAMGRSGSLHFAGGGQAASRPSVSHASSPATSAASAGLGLDDPTRMLDPPLEMPPLPEDHAAGEILGQSAPSQRMASAELNSTIVSDRHDYTPDSGPTIVNLGYSNPGHSAAEHSAPGHGVSGTSVPGHSLPLADDATVELTTGVGRSLAPTDPNLLPPEERKTLLHGTGPAATGAPTPSTTVSLRTSRRPLIYGGVIAVLAALGVVIGVIIASPPDESPGTSGSGDTTALAVGPLDQGSGAPQRDQPDQRISAAVLEVTTSPPGAAVRLDDEPLGLTPLHRSLPPGTHQVTVALGGYDSQSEEVTLRGGKTETLRFVLRKESRPDTPATPSIRPHPRRRHVHRSRPAPKRPTVVRPRPTKPSPVTPAPVKPAYGYLTISTIPWSWVYLGSRKLGQTPLAKVRVPAGKHRLYFTNPEHGKTYEQVVVKPGKVTKVRLRLR